MARVALSPLFRGKAEKRGGCSPLLCPSRLMSLGVDASPFVVVGYARMQLDAIAICAVVSSFFTLVEDLALSILPKTILMGIV